MFCYVQAVAIIAKNMYIMYMMIYNVKIHVYMHHLSSS